MAANTNGSRANSTAARAKKNLSRFEEFQKRARETKQKAFGDTANVYVIRPEDGFDIKGPFEIEFPDYERYAAIQRAYKLGDEASLVPLVLGDAATPLNEALKRQCGPGESLFVLIEITYDAMRALFGEGMFESGKA